ncbi:MAG: transcriptional activator RfaH [Alphaproteobacteria bacterium]|nr:MAG: transcriptional activator RfaH [Alphaproteobacteria bacterium]
MANDQRHSLPFREGPALANSADGKVWFLAQLKPNCANIARRNLERQGFEIFLPFEVETRLHGRRQAFAKVPLFPGYLFLALDPETSPWRKVNSTLGIARLVSFGTHPAPVPYHIIDELMRRCDAAGRLIELPKICPGDQVRITGGPLSSFVAQVERIEPNKRVWLLMDIMGGKTQVTVAQADVRLAS